MIPTQSLVNFPEFANNGTKVAPESAKYAAGYIPSEVLPAEHLNYFFNKSSAGQTAINEGLTSVETEINNVLSQASITPDAETNTQLMAAFKKFLNGEKSCVNVTTAVDAAPAATGVGFIASYFEGLKLTVFFENGYYGSGNITLDINNIGAKKLYVPKNGNMIVMPSKSIDRNDTHGTQNWFIQPNTALELEFKQSLDSGTGGWVVLCNPIVLSGTDYAYAANGDSITDLDKAANVLPVANGGTGAATEALARTNLGVSYDKTALYGLWVSTNTEALTTATQTFEPTTPTGTPNLNAGATVKVTFRYALQSSQAITGVYFAFGGRLALIKASKGGSLVSLTSHEFTGGNYSSTYKYKVWDAYTTLELMWTGNEWLVMNNPVLCSYENGSGNGYRIYSDGYIEQWGLLEVTTVDYTVIGWYVQLKNTDYVITVTPSNTDNSTPATSYTWALINKQPTFCTYTWNGQRNKGWIVNWNMRGY